MVKRRVPSKDLHRQPDRWVAEQMDTDTHAQAGRERRTDGPGQGDGQTEVLAERGIRSMKVWGERNRQETWRRRSKEGDAR